MSSTAFVRARVVLLSWVALTSSACGRAEPTQAPEPPRFTPWQPSLGADPGAARPTACFGAWIGMPSAELASHLPQGVRFGQRYEGRPPLLRDLRERGKQDEPWVRSQERRPYHDAEQVVLDIESFGAPICQVIVRGEKVVRIALHQVALADVTARWGAPDLDPPSTSHSEQETTRGWWSEANHVRGVLKNTRETDTNGHVTERDGALVIERVVFARELFGAAQGAEPSPLEALLDAPPTAGPTHGVFPVLSTARAVEEDDETRFTPERDPQGRVLRLRALLPAETFDEVRAALTLRYGEPATTAEGDSVMRFSGPLARVIVTRMPHRLAVLVEPPEPALDAPTAAPAATSPRRTSAVRSAP